MTKKILLSIFSGVLFALPQTSMAQHYNSDSTWVTGGHIGLHINQVQQSNWSAGGDNLFGGNLMLNYSANYKKGKHLWDNRLELEYGANITDTDGTRKTSDKIYLSSNYGYLLCENLYLSGTLLYQSQFANGYNYGKDGADDLLVSTFMAPGYLTIGAGLTWTPKPWFKSTLNPAAYKGVFLLDDVLSEEGGFGVKPGDKHQAQFGANLTLEVNKDILKNVNLYSRVLLYSNYLENPQNVDVNWEVKVHMSINKWLSASVNTNLIYDDDIDIVDGKKKGPKVQFQEVLGFGLQFTI